MSMADKTSTTELSSILVKAVFAHSDGVTDIYILIVTLPLRWRSHLKRGKRSDILIFLPEYCTIATIIQMTESGSFVCHY